MDVSLRQYFPSHKCCFGYYKFVLMIQPSLLGFTSSSFGDDPHNFLFFKEKLKVLLKMRVKTIFIGHDQSQTKCYNC